ncbi:MAG: hypothetical protein JF599_12330 [Verrucomicrobia bacterium]|nr:hypothetical protein [Verrucomicrobiota bacterium]
MNKAYWIGPMVALMVFGGIFFNFKSGYEAKQKAHEEQVQAEKQAKLKGEVEARRKAVEDALRVQAERKKEREAKEADERARKEARQVALDARDKVFHEQDRLAKQVENLKRDIATEQDAIAKISRDRQDSIAEQTFLKAYVEKAQENVKSLQDVLLKITQAEAARAAAEAAAKKNATS